ncbi:MAG: DUF547 domain-containing protein [Thermoleophilia bacterium]
MSIKSGPERDEENTETSGPLEIAPDAGSAAMLQEAIRVLFDRFVSDDGLMVDYDALLTSEEYRTYERASEQLAGFDLLTMELREKRLAFWINFYNMAVLQEVSALEGVSQDDLKRLFERKVYNLGGLDYSLKDIEYGILRGNARQPNRAWRYWRNWDRRLRNAIKPPEPRAHFALTRGASSGPALRFYEPALIEGQLYEAALGFVRNGGAVIDREKNLLSLSQIFRDYSADFGGGQGVIRFIADHLESEDAAWVRSQAGRMKIKYHGSAPELDARV